MRRFYACAVLAISCLVIGPNVAQAQVILHDEGLSGDLSNDPLIPSPFVLSLGGNRIIGSVAGGPDTRDWVTVTIPIGFQMSVLTHVAYASTDAQGFMGYVHGPNFPGGLAGVNTPSNYRGYAHFGTGATNGTLPTTNTVGQNMFTIMSNPSAYFPGQEPQGVTLPLGPGPYTFLFQQTGPALTGYEFSFEVVAIPEPTSLLLVAAGIAAAGIMRRRGRITS